LIHVISTEAAQFHRAAQWRDPCISIFALAIISSSSGNQNQ
jgi:hypothetical protein